MEALRNSPSTHCAWIDKESTELKLRMGGRIFQPTRQDRLTMSIVRSMATEDSLKSGDFLEKVTITAFGTQSRTKPLATHEVRELQDLACYLRVSLLLNHDDVRAVCEEARRAGLVWGVSRNDNLHFRKRHLQDLVRQSLEQPMQAMLLQQVKAAMSDNKKLIQLANTYGLQLLNRTLAGKQILLLHVGGRDWQAFCHDHTLSAIFTPALPSPAYPQTIVSRTVRSLPVTIAWRSASPANLARKRSMSLWIACGMLQSFGT